jgi:acyl-CoA thioester hydrolase
MKPEISRLVRARYPFFADVQTRNADMDHLQHINNIAIAGYYDEARSQFTRRIFDQAGDITGVRLVTAQANVSYLAEAFHPGDVRIGCGINRIGAAAYEIGQALFQRDRCIGVCTAVFVNAPRAGSTPLPENLRAVLKGYLLEGALPE